MLGQHRRVEEDLERIRKANRSPEQAAREDAQERALKKRLKEEPFGAKDIFAMIIAIFSLILPYLLAFVGILGSIVFAIWWFAGRQ